MAPRPPLSSARAAQARLAGAVRQFGPDDPRIPPLRRTWVAERFIERIADVVGDDDTPVLTADQAHRLGIVLQPVTDALGATSDVRRAVPA